MGMAVGFHHHKALQLLKKRSPSPERSFGNASRSAEKAMRWAAVAVRASAPNGQDLNVENLEPKHQVLCAGSIYGTEKRVRSLLSLRACYYLCPFSRRHVIDHQSGMGSKGRCPSRPRFSGAHSHGRWYAVTSFISRLGLHLFYTFTLDVLLITLFLLRICACPGPYSNCESLDAAAKYAITRSFERASSVAKTYSCTLQVEAAVPACSRPHLRGGRRCHLRRLRLFRAWDQGVRWPLRPAVPG